MITDARHLSLVLEQLLINASALGNEWIKEEQAAAAPSSSPDGPSKPGHSDPTFETAGRPRIWTHRDRIGSTLLSVSQRLSDEVAKLKPRTPPGPCRCCKERPATHGRNDRGDPTSCWSCDQYLRRVGVRCDEEKHANYPTVRMCECPHWCCDRDEDGDTSCPDRAADGRHYSERCKRRMAPDRRKVA